VLLLLVLLEVRAGQARHLQLARHPAPTLLLLVLLVLLLLLVVAVLLLVLFRVWRPRQLDQLGALRPPLLHRHVARQRQNTKHGPTHLQQLHPLPGLWAGLGLQLLLGRPADQLLEEQGRLLLLILALLSTRFLHAVQQDLGHM
jgi:hypothetical protein